MLTLQQLLNDALMGRRPRRRAAPKTKIVAIFPCGGEAAFKKKAVGSHVYFSLTTPSGALYESSVRDIKWLLEKDVPGVRYERRPI